MGMARGLSDGLLRFCNGAWRDDDGDAVDIVEVVRCKDCKYWDEDRRCNGIKNGLVMEYTWDDDFCSYGERKEL